MINGGFFRFLRRAALIAIAVGAAGSIGLLLHESQRRPRVLLVLFFFWVLFPFVALTAASAVSKRWSTATRTTLHVAMLIVALGSLAIYADDARGHRRPQAAFVYVAVPPASLLLVAMVVPIAAFVSGRRSNRSDGPRQV